MAKNGQIYTPDYIVNMMLDYASYNVSQGILFKHIIDNSCGDGRILSEVVRRYILSYKEMDPFLTDAEASLGTYIHGVDIDEDELEKCRKNLDDVAAEYGVYNVAWDLTCGNTLKIADRFRHMDYVIANPPYIRIHDTDEDIKQYSFSAECMGDLYLAFYEVGLKMLNEHGIMCYISPSSWLTSKSGANMRKWIESTHRLNSVIDFEHTKVFEKISTYVMIALFDNSYHSYIRYDRYNPDTHNLEPKYFIPYKKAFIGGELFFGSEDHLDMMRTVNGFNGGGGGKRVRVKNGYATLLDDFFIDEFNSSRMKSPFEIHAIKASTGKWSRCLFPYKLDDEKKYVPVTLDEIREESDDTYNYIIENEERLRGRAYEKRGSDDIWWVFGRSQCINDTKEYKLSVNSTIKSTDDIRITRVPTGCGVYGGLYIIPLDVFGDGIESCLKSNDFMEYVKMLRKYKSGGYYSFSGKDLEKYLNYRLSNGK